MAKPYVLLDSGNFQKLEQIGPYRVVRQATQAFWPKSVEDAQWRRADGIHVRSKSGGGFWKFPHAVSESWDVTHGGFLFKIKPTPFGHLGLFAEQEVQWAWLSQVISGKDLHVLNLFGYTGGSTMAAAMAGARVTHVDASKGAVTWARENAGKNNLDARPIRWIVEDVGRYVRREFKRNNKYQGLILDPPTFGRGSGGEQWRIERDLVPLLFELKRLADPLEFVLLSCHTPGYSPLCLAQILAHVFGLESDQVTCGEMTVAHHATPGILPSGTFARWALA